ncbi:MAG: hypothetical protein D6706_14960 [Chloroflexi bacterium]|nr:MAG: hypothetical protein D6706_14960 [Chloroflexota bacterium]
MSHKPKINHDIENSTSLTVGVENYEGTKAVRAFHIPGSEISGTGRKKIKNGLEIYINSHKTNVYGEYVHPDYEDKGSGSNIKVGDLPLNSVRGYKYGDGIIGSAVYGRTGVSVPRYDAFQFARETSFHAGKRYIRYYPDENLVLLPWDNENSKWSKDPAKISTGWKSSVNTVRVDYVRNQIVVRTVLPFHPMPIILSKAGVGSFTELQGVMNSKSFVINGIRRPKQTLRFDAIQIKPFGGTGKLKYLVEYQFLEDAHTWANRISLWKRYPCGGIRLNQPPTYPTLGHPNCEGESTDSDWFGKWAYVYKDILVSGTFVICNWTRSGIKCYRYEPTHRPLDFRGIFPTHDSPSGYDGVTINFSPNKRRIR